MLYSTHAEVAVLGGGSDGAEHGGDHGSSAGASDDLTAVGREGHLFEKKKTMEKRRGSEKGQVSKMQSWDQATDAQVRYTERFKRWIDRRAA